MSRTAKQINLSLHKVPGATLDLVEISAEDISYCIDLLVEELARRIDETKTEPVERGSSN